MHTVDDQVCDIVSMINYVYPRVYWGEPERAPHWLKSVMVSYVACTDCENDKIRWTSYSMFHKSHVQTVSVEGLMK